MVEAHDWSLRPHAQQATRPSPTTQADMRPESQRRKRSSFIKAKLMLRLSFFFFRKPSCARMRPPENVPSRKPPETRPINETVKRHAGKGPRDEALGGTPRRNAQKCSKLASNVAFFSAPQLPTRHRLRCSATYPQVDSLRRYARFLLRLKNTTFEAHFEQTQEPARKTPQRKKARVARCAAQQWLE